MYENLSEEQKIQLIKRAFDKKHGGDVGSSHVASTSDAASVDVKAPVNERIVHVGFAGVWGASSLAMYFVYSRNQSVFNKLPVIPKASIISMACLTAAMCTREIGFAVFGR